MNRVHSIFKKIQLLWTCEGGISNKSIAFQHDVNIINWE